MVPLSDELWIKGKPTYIKGTNSITISDLSVDNESDVPLDGWLVVGVYDEVGNMIGVRNEILNDVAAEIDSEICTVSLGVNSVDDVALVKAMLWDGASTLKPYHDAVEICYPIYETEDLT